MITPHMRNLAKQETFTRTDVISLMDNIASNIKICHLLNINEDFETGLNPEDSDEARRQAIWNLRTSLQEFEDNLFPEEAAERENEQKRYDAALRDAAGQNIRKIK